MSYNAFICYNKDYSATTVKSKFTFHLKMCDYCMWWQRVIQRWRSGCDNAIITFSSYTPECVNNKITFSADEWRENAIKRKTKAIQCDIYNVILFIKHAARAWCHITHKTVGRTCQQLSELPLKHYSSTVSFYSGLLLNMITVKNVNLSEKHAEFSFTNIIVFMSRLQFSCCC